MQFFHLHLLGPLSLPGTVLGPGNSKINDKLRQTPSVSWAQVAEKALVITSHLFSLIPPSKLKKQVNWLIRRLKTLTSTNLKPFYISQVIGVGVRRKQTELMHSTFIEQFTLMPVFVNKVSLEPSHAYSLPYSLHVVQGCL